MLAYFDSFAGLVPCRIVATGDWQDNSSPMRVQYTATRGPYKRGQCDTWTRGHIVPRDKIRRSKYGSSTILAYDWAKIARR